MENKEIMKSLEYYFKSLDLNKEIDNKIEIARSFNNIGFIYEQQGNYEKRLSFQYKSLELYKKLESKSDIGTSYLNIGNILKKQGNYQKD